MSRLIFVTGGARSGKSTFAEKFAKQKTNKVTYLATGLAFDKGMEHRIQKHKDQRPDHWELIETYKEFNKISEIDAYKRCDLLLVDCLTILVSNHMIYSGIDFDTCLAIEVDELEVKIKEEVANLLKHSSEKDMIIVSNEIGMGIVPPYKMGAYFRDIAGRMNQFVASIANDVYFVVSGIDIKIK
ncbi:MAG: bifunctional adenosylcobinamide kinase/adenosylcobinamide-phosphate guanylyltransferase [Acidaminobacteraceae bacterium]